MNGGRRLRDGGYVVETGGNQDGKLGNSAEAASISSKGLKIPSSALQAAQRRLQESQQGLHENQRQHQISLSAVALSADTSSLAKTILHAQAAFTSQGRVLGVRITSDILDVNLPGPEEEDDPRVHDRQHGSASYRRDEPASGQSLQSASMCKLCLAEIRAASMEMHTLRCSKNPAYHKVLYKTF